MSLDDMRAAAALGDPVAQSVLGYKYDVGEDVPQDHAMAASWYRRAAERGYANAQFNLAEMLLDGVGVEQSSEQAFAWYSKAAIQGHSTAQYNLAVMYSKGEGVVADNRLAYVWFALSAEGDADGAIQAREMVAKEIGDQIDEANKILADLKATIAAKSSYYGR